MIAWDSRTKRYFPLRQKRKFKGKSITLSISPTPLHITTVLTLYRASSSH